MSKHQIKIEDLIKQSKKKIPNRKNKQNSIRVIQFTQQRKRRIENSDGGSGK